LRPYQYGQLYRAAIKRGKVEPVDTSEDNNIGAPAPLKIENHHRQANSINVSVMKRQYLKISVSGPCTNGINLVVMDKSTDDGELAESHQFSDGNGKKKVNHSKNCSHSEYMKHSSSTSKMKNYSSNERQERERKYETHKSSSDSRRNMKTEYKRSTHESHHKTKE